MVIPFMLQPVKAVLTWLQLLNFINDIGRPTAVTVI